ncbi:LacI family DNA-binding transcriptional regulator [Salinicola peritrichatus]|uniref:LacI family DNA-binding transcriptional regulator n=1 Tax=Salinicola peritrichatus TaxID=1267424 RepID=UPI000DA112C3|nr:LacI family DNA-binding transcriptional regulator [Salinicola peritrichatus]
MTENTPSTPTMVDVAKAAGVGVATVDRVLSGRANVRPQTAEKVRKAAETLGYQRLMPISEDPSRVPQRPSKRLGFVLQKRTTAVYRVLADALIDASRSYRDMHVTPIVEYLEILEPDRVAAALARLGATVDAIGVVSTDHPVVAQTIGQLRDQGVPVFALVTDLAADSGCAGYVGHDCRKVGRTAAWAMSRMATHGPLGIITGSHRYVSQELHETGFRGYLRERAPQFSVIEPIFTGEDPAVAAQALRRLLDSEATLGGLYVAGGGIEGVIDVLRESPRPGLVTICHDLTATTRAALIDGTVDLVLSLPRRELAERAVAALLASLDSDMDTQPGASKRIILPIDIFTPENV